MNCKICGKKISVLNESGKCFYHDETPIDIKTPFKTVVSGGGCDYAVRYTQDVEDGYMDPSTSIEEDF